MRWIRIPYLERPLIQIFSLPEAVDNMHLDEGSYVLVEVAHEEVHVVQVVEVPALGDERVPEKIAERDGADVGLVREILDGRESDRRGNQLTLAGSPFPRRADRMRERRWHVTGLLLFIMVLFGVA